MEHNGTFGKQVSRARHAGTRIPRESEGTSQRRVTAAPLRIPGLATSRSPHRLLDRTGAIDLTGHYYAGGLKPILGERDLLLIDPRGVGRSGAIQCSALEDLTRILQDVDSQRAATGECGRQLGAKAAYHGTAAAADDFEDVRSALGIDRVDLLGDSHGTYLMTTLVARHPEHVDSVVLSGAFERDPATQPVAVRGRGAGEDPRETER